MSWFTSRNEMLDVSLIESDRLPDTVTRPLVTSTRGPTNQSQACRDDTNQLSAHLRRDDASSTEASGFRLAPRTNQVTLRGVITHSQLSLSVIRRPRPPHFTRRDSGCWSPRSRVLRRDQRDCATPSGSGQHCFRPGELVRHRARGAPPPSSSSLYLSFSAYTVLLLT